jgi:hypothetical protein
MRHLWHNLSVIGAAAEDFFLPFARFRGPFALVTCHFPKGYLKVRYFINFPKSWDSYLET